MKRHLDRGLHYRRTAYRPGLGICSCESCAAKHDAQMWAHRRYGARVEPMGTQNQDCAYLNREAVFAAEWEMENEACSRLNWGHGILQDLMVLDRQAERNQSRIYGGFGGRLYRRVAFLIRKRGRVIAATAIQWLGSNCGFAWLSEVLRKCGYEIRRIDERREAA